jgi:hypothetical protein
MSIGGHLQLLAVFALEGGQYDRSNYFFRLRSGALMTAVLELSDEDASLHSFNEPTLTGAVLAFVQAIILYNLLIKF